VFVFGVTFTVDGEELPLAFPWYTPLGIVVTLLVGGGLSLRHRRQHRGQDATSTVDAGNPPHGNTKSANTAPGFYNGWDTGSVYRMCRVTFFTTESYVPSLHM